eukprot:g4035.t1
MSCDPTSAIAKVEKGQGYYRRSEPLPALSGAQELVAWTQGQLDDLSGSDRSVDNAMLRIRKFRAVVTRYFEVNGRFPFAFREPFSNDSPIGNLWKYPELVLVDWETGGSPDEEMSLDEAMLSLKQRLGIAPFRLHSARLRLTPTLHSYREDFFQTLSVSQWAQGGELIYAGPIEDEALADGLRKLSSVYGIGVTSFGLTGEVLDDLPRPANILNAHPKETEAIMAKLSVDRLAGVQSKAHLDWAALNSMRSESKETDKLINWLKRCVDERRAEPFKDDRGLLPEGLRKQLEDFRKQLWRRKVIEAAAAGLIGLLLSFLLVFALDRVWPTPGWMRLVVLLCGVSLCAGFAPYWLHRWVWGHRRESQLARLISRKYPGLGDRLLGVIELQEQGDTGSSASPRLRAAAMEVVAAESRKRDLDLALPAPRHLKWGVAAVALVVVAAVAFVVTPEAGVNALERWIKPFSKVERYTFTQLENPPGYLAVPFGEAFSVRLMLSGKSKQNPPRAYGQYDSQPAVGAALGDGGYEFQFPGQQEPGIIAFKVGDQRHRMKVEPMQRPFVESTRVYVDFPAYMQLPKREIELTAGEIGAVAGTRLVFEMNMSRPVRAGEYGPTIVSGELGQKGKFKEASGELKVSGRKITTAPLEVDAVPFEIPFAWKDEFGLSGGDDFKLRVDAVKDTPPVAYTQGIDRQIAILPEEVLDFEILCEDDFGLKRVGIEWESNGTLPGEKPVGKGELVVADGGAETRRLLEPVSFSPAAFGIGPQRLLLRSFSEDYFPGRGRSYSEPVMVYVLSREEHAQLLKSQFDRTISELEDLARKELNLLDENQRLERLDGAELQKEENQRRIEEQEAAENENAERMEELKKRMEELMKDATRNGDIDKETLKKMAGALKSMQELAEKDLPEVSEKLREAKEPSNTPEKTESDVAEAVEEQKEAVEKMQKALEQANEANKRFEASTFVSRLKKAASEENGIVSALVGGFEEVLGLRGSEVDPADLRMLAETEKQQMATASDVRWIQEDLGHYHARTQDEGFKEILNQMTDSKINTGLDAVRTKLQKNHSFTATEEAKRWAEKLSEWADTLAEEMDKNGGGGGGGGAPSPEDEDFEFMLREAAEVAKSDLEKHQNGSEQLADEQDELSADVQQLVMEQTVEQVIDLLSEVEGIMDETTDYLADYETGGKTIAAQTEIIEKIHAAAKAKQSSGQGGEAGGAMMDMMERMMGKKSGGEKKGEGNPGDQAGEGQTGDSDSPSASSDGNAGKIVGERTGLLNRQDDTIPPQVELIYERGLRYLAENQNEQGYWNDGSSGSEPGVVGLCIAAFLAHGEDPANGPYAETIRRGIDYILSKQNKNNGYIGNSMYNHAFAAKALAESYGVIDHPDLAQALKRAVDLIVAAQKRNRAGGWRYNPDSTDADTTVAGCQMVTLFAARNAGISVPDETIKKGLAYLASCRGSDGSYGYTSSAGGKPTLTAIGSLCLSLAKETDSRGYRASLDYLSKKLDFRERYYPYYYEYYMAQALFHADEQLFLPAILLLAAAATLYSQEVREDIVRFTNGDQLHGEFSGLESGPAVSWKRKDMEEAVKFESSGLRQVILRGGRPETALPGLEHIGTVNGDRFPGVISSLDENEVVLETEYAGRISIPRARVGLLAPNPLGGRIVYQGPFAADEWSMIDFENPDGFPAVAEGKVGPPLWNFSGSAWYWQDNPMGTALVRKTGVPDKAVIRFDISWKNRLALAMAFHAGFDRPEMDEEQKETIKGFSHPGHPNHMPLLFGSSYILQLNSHYVVLARTGFDEDGKPRFDRVQTSNTSVRLGDSGTASIELRCNRSTGEIILFVDGEFVVQWSELPDEDGGGSGYAGEGGGIGFFAQADQSAVRVSEVVVAEWNGMPDAARSLQVDDADIVLLSNGTDRVSGKVTGINDGTLYLDGRYGNFEIPIGDVAEVRFGRGGLDEVGEEADSDQVKVRFYPTGRISGQPIAGNGAVREITFEPGETDFGIPDQRLTLVNGDVLPVTVTGLAGDMLTASSPDLGTLEIPRDAVDTLQLGIVPTRVVFSGPEGLGGWILDSSNQQAWEIRNGRFLARENGTIARDVALPEKFIIRFRLSWKNRPNFRFFFADPLKDAGERVNRYFLQFAGAGMELKRESTGASRYSTVALIDRPPERFSRNSMEIEIRMDRSTGLIQFYLDGELEGRYADRISDIPAGSGIAFQSQAPPESEQEIRNIEVLEWDDRGDRHRSEERGDGREDSLIGRFGERFSGGLTAIREGEEGAVYVFKSDFQKERIELPEEEVSTIFFAGGKEKDFSEMEGLVVKLRGGGEIRVSACEFGEKEGNGAVVRFSNGDQLIGKAVSLGIESVEWESPVLAEPARFDLRNVVDLRMSKNSGKESGFDAGHVAQLQMTNGDVFRGKLAGLSDEEIKLKTWYAGELVFRRVNVEQVKISSGGRLIYRGPSGMDEWTDSETAGNWTFKAGGLHAAGIGGIGREMDFAEENSIAFTAEWKGNFRPRILFFTGDISTRNPETGFSMEFHGNSVHVKNLNNNGFLGQPRNTPGLRNVEKAEFEIRASKRTGEIFLYIDGELMGAWEDDEIKSRELGKGFHIVAQDRTPMRFSEIRISEWDGYVDESEKRLLEVRNNNIQFRNGLRVDEAAGDEVEEGDGIPEGRMVFHNGDSIKGEVVKVDGDDITVKTEFSDVTFPVGRLKNLVLKKADMETPKRYKGDVRATLTDGSKIVFRLDGVEEGKLQGFSQNFGAAEFLEESFKRIEFNIYDRAMEELRSQDDW